MLGIVIATHGRLADELLKTAMGVVGDIAQARAVTVDAASSVEDARDRLGEAIRAVDAGDGVVVLTDMFGGTPANLALTFLDDRIAVVTGVNLPMVVKLAGAREGSTPAAAAQLITAYGQKNITDASALLRARTATRG